MILFVTSLLAGCLTVLAPCTISLLPVIVGGSLQGQQHLKRALVVTASLGLSVIIFTLLLKFSSSLIAVPQQFWQWVSGGIIAVLGITMLFPTLWEKLPLVGKLNRGSNKLIAVGYQKQSLVGDVLVGASLGPVFSSCSPTYFLILATVLPRSIAEGLIYLLAYAVGLCASLLIVTVASQRLLEKFGVASDPNGWLKRSIGVLFLLLGIAIIAGYDKKLELVVANNIIDVTKIEQYLLTTQQPSAIPDVDVASSTVVGTPTTTAPTSTVKPLVKTVPAPARYSKAPEITNPSGFVNTDGQPITLAQLRGKEVVLVDFWTYSCINCQRTLPYLKAWYDKYHHQGLEIVGIHTPEFAFEKVQTNVENAVRNTFNLKYPVVLDNDYGTWNAFGNQFWPRKYLINLDGDIVYDHIGEGAYDLTEQAIQQALAERARRLGTTAPATTTVTVPPAAASPADGVESPEIYFGAARNRYLANGVAGQSGPQTFTLPTFFIRNLLYLAGPWAFTGEYAESGQVGAKVVFKYKAKEVYMVASSANGATLCISVDGQPVAAAAGADVAQDGTARVRDNRLYHLIHGTDYSEHTLEIEVQSGNLQAYTFTFG